MAQKIQADYDTLERIAHELRQHNDALVQLHRQVISGVNTLEAGDWTGQGASQFFAEMRERVFPGLAHLSDALREANQAVIRTSTILHSAEDEAGRLFTGTASRFERAGGSQLAQPGSLPMPPFATFRTGGDINPAYRQAGGFFCNSINAGFAGDLGVRGANTAAFIGSTSPSSFTTVGGAGRAGGFFCNSINAGFAGDLGVRGANTAAFVGGTLLGSANSASGAGRVRGFFCNTISGNVKAVSTSSTAIRN